MPNNPAERPGDQTGSGGRDKLALHRAILCALPANAANDLATFQIDNGNHLHAASLARWIVIVDGLHAGPNANRLARWRFG